MILQKESDHDPIPHGGQRQRAQHHLHPTTSEAQAFALLQALSDATMARLYLHKGNLPAARRKAVQLLKALQVLEVQQ